MARFIGRVQGSRGGVKRLGGAGGLTTVAASWSGAVKVTMYDNEGADFVCIQFITWNSAGCDHVLYNGPAAGRKRWRKPAKRTLVYTGPTGLGRY